MSLPDPLPEAAGIRVSTEGSMLRVTLDRPERGNRLGYPQIVALRDLFRALADERRIRAILISGAGESFCLGEEDDNLGEWPKEYSHRRPAGSQGPAPVPQQDMLSALRAVPSPTVVKLQGRVEGLGLDLAAVCDLRLVARDCQIADGRVRGAEIVSTGLTHVLPRLIGLSQATRLLLVGDEIDGTEAARIGLAYRAYEAGELDGAAEEMLTQLSTMATRSYAIVKQQVLDELDMPYQAALMHSMGIRQTNVIEDRQEGQRAFLEKRDAEYVGR